MNRSALLMRDPAAAAVLGALPDGGADFGDESDWATHGAEEGYTYDPTEWEGVAEQFGDFAGDFGWEPEMGFGYEFGDEFGAAPSMQDVVRGLGQQQMALHPYLIAQGIQGHVGPQMTPQVAAAIAAAQAAGAIPPPGAGPAAYAAMAHRAAASPSRSRAMLLEPNLGSTVKVERFVFALSQVITALGTGQAIAMRDTPDTNIRPQRVTANAPSVGFVILSSIRVGNVDAVVGSSVDAFDFNANGQGQSLDMPTLKTATKLTVDGTYTGLVPSPLTGTGPYTFTVSFKGPSTLTA